jgi:Zn-dependent protease with chaperone function
VVSTTPTKTQAKTRASSGMIPDLPSEPLKTARPSIFYVLGLFIVAFFMLLLPLVYLAMIGGVVYGAYYHAVHNVDVLNPGHVGSSHGMLLRIVAYGGPFVIGALLVFFMSKPLLARPSREEDPLTLDRAQEPALFVFIQKLCVLLGAPLPRRIEVICAVNAAASFEGGLIGLLKKDLVLKIGLPLAAGLDLQQFTGVLAHELGHFTQGTGRVLNYIINRTNVWFARVVYERDEWDEKLVQWARENDIRIAIIFHVTRLLVWLTRRVLWVLMLVGRAASCLLMRQAEYHADRFEAQVAGAGAFEATTLQMGRLAMAWGLVHRDLELSWKEKRLVDNLPVLVAAKARQFTSSQASAVDSLLQEERTGLFSTHPSPSSRVKAARERNDPGVFHSRQPATSLFSNFKMIANAVTLAYYRRVPNLHVETGNLVPVERLVAEHKAIWDEQNVLKRYFQGCMTFAAPFFPKLATMGPPAHPKDTAAKLKVARQKTQAIAAEAYEAYGKAEEAEHRIAVLTFASALVRAGQRVPAKDVGIPVVNRETVSAALEEAIARREAMAGSLEKFEKLARFRLAAALQLAHISAVAERVEKATQLIPQAGRILRALAAVEAGFVPLSKISRSFVALGTMLKVTEHNAKWELDDSVSNAVLRSLCEDMQFQLEEVKSRLTGTAYPFEHAAGNIAMASYALKTRAIATKPHTLLEAADELQENLKIFYFRAMGRLGLLAESVEAVLGMPPLPEAEHKPKAESGEKETK